jgi:hypothetical protein
MDVINLAGVWRKKKYGNVVKKSDKIHAVLFADVTCPGNSPVFKVQTTTRSD